MSIQPLPERIVGIEMPGDGFGICESGLLPFVIATRFLEIQEIVVLCLHETRLGSLERTLVAAVLAIDRSRHIHPAELLDVVITHTVLENVAPRMGERPEASRHMGPNRGTLRTRRSLAAAPIEFFEHGRIRNRGRVNVTDALLSHRDLLC